MTTAVVYTRFSPRPNAQECDSCEKQEERCVAYCQKMGYFPGYLIKDEDVTGGTIDREGLQSAFIVLEAIDEEKILVVDSVDRLSRDMLIFFTIKSEIEKRGARIEYANGLSMPDTPEGKLIGNIMAAFAAYERDRTKYATSRGIKRRQANGEWFGKPPVGWMRDPKDSKKLIRNEQEQEAIRYANVLSKGGLSSEKIAKWLTKDKGPFRGNPWSARTVRKILAREKE